jgi:RimJ/RimL family protein N-acetyltransferase
LRGISVQDLKVSSMAEAFTFSIQINEAAHLLPVGKWILEDNKLVGLMCKWRAENKESFFAQIEPDIRSMMNYLESRSIRDDRTLLFIIVSGGHPLGHIGLSQIKEGSASLDQVMKGVRKYSDSRSKGIMQSAITALIDWSRATLGLNVLHLEVVSSNHSAIELYEKCNFVITQKIPVKAIQTVNGVFLEEDKTLVDSKLKKLSMSLEL